MTPVRRAPTFAGAAMLLVLVGLGSCGRSSERDEGAVSEQTGETDVDPQRVMVESILAQARQEGRGNRLDTARAFDEILNREDGLAALPESNGMVGEAVDDEPSETWLLRALAWVETLLNSPARVYVIGDRDEANHYPDCVAVGNGATWCCSGTLIEPDVVLTATHCGGQCDSTWVMVERDTNDPASRTMYPGVRVACEWLDGRDDKPPDVAVIVLKAPVPDAPVRIIGGAGLLDHPGTSGIRVAGYGVDNTTGQGGDGERRVQDIPLEARRCIEGTIADTHECRPEFEFVAGKPFRNKDTCRGDSGGPAYALVENEWVLVGVTLRPSARISPGRRCGDGSIYARIDELDPLIRHAISVGRDLRDRTNE